MKASEMTNEELAKELECGASKYDPCEDDDDVGTHEILREAAARLRRPTPVDDDLLKMAHDIDTLRAKLKVAEDALVKIRAEANQRELDTDDTGTVFDTADNALAAIREKGGVK